MTLVVDSATGRPPAPLAIRRSCSARGAAWRFWQVYEGPHSAATTLLLALSLWNLLAPPRDSCFCLEYQPRWIRF